MNNYRGDVLAIIAVLMLGGSIYGLFKIAFPAESKELLIFIMGVLAGIVKDVYSFEFGTSKSGERSAQAVARIAEAPSTSVTAPQSIKAEDVKVEAAGDVTVERAP